MGLPLGLPAVAYTERSMLQPPLSRSWEGGGVISLHVQIDDAKSSDVTFCADGIWEVSSLAWLLL